MHPNKNLSRRDPQSLSPNHCVHAAYLSAESRSWACAQRPFTHPQARIRAHHGCRCRGDAPPRINMLQAVGRFPHEEPGKDKMCKVCTGSFAMNWLTNSTSRPRHNGNVETLAKDQPMHRQAARSPLSASRSSQWKTVMGRSMADSKLVDRMQVPVRGTRASSILRRLAVGSPPAACIE